MNGDVDDTQPIDDDENIFLSSLGFGGLGIYNFTDRNQKPVLLNRINIQGSAEYFTKECQPNVIISANKENGIQIYNIENILNPILLSQYNSFTTESSEISVFCNLLYVADGINGLTILNLSDLTHISIKG